MTNDLTTHQPGDLAPGHSLADFGAVANRIAGALSFGEYRSKRAANTITRQDNDLRLFCDYLLETGALAHPGNFSEDTKAWEGVTWGLVAGFVRWLLAAGYAVSSCNVRLSTVKTYAALAAQAGALDRQELALIQTVHGYRRKEAKHIDETRESAGVQTRRTTRRPSERAGVLIEAQAGRKAQPVALTPKQAQALKALPDTPQGRRDRLIMCLLLDHGLRVGEVAGLSVSNFDLKAGELYFYRPKVDRLQTHRLTPDTLSAARAYLAQDAPAIGPLLRGSRKGKGSKHNTPGDGVLTAQGMTARAITERVKVLGLLMLDLPGLSAHDCRHYWATQAARNGTPIERLKDAGGWSSLAMPERYIEAAKIANEGVRLS